MTTLLVNRFVDPRHADDRSENTVMPVAIGRVE